MRVVPFTSLDVAFQYARYVMTLAHSRTLYVLPHAVVLETNGQTLFITVREDEGD